MRFGKLGQIGLDLAREFALVHEELVRSVGREHGEAERQRRVRHVAATDVEGPGDGGGVGENGMGGAVLRDRHGQTGQLVLGEFAGETLRMQLDRRERWRWLVLPDDVDRIGGERHQRRARLRGGLRQSLDLADRVQPGVEAEPGALAEIVLNP